MAKIILDIDLNASGAQSALTQIQEQLNGITKAYKTIPRSSGAMINNLQKVSANLLNTIKNAKSSYGEGIFGKHEKDARIYLNEIKELNDEYQQNGKLSKEQKKIYRSLSKQVKALSAAFATTRAESDKLQKSNKLAVPSFDALRGRLASLSLSVQSVSKNYKSGTFTKITDEISRLQKELSATGGMDKTSKEYAVKMNEIDKAINKLGADYKTTRAAATNFHGSLKDIVTGFLKFQLAARLVMAPIQAIRKAWQSLNETLVETEDRILAIRRIIGTQFSAGDMAKELYDIAIAYGQTFENVSEIATNFARSGLAWKDTIEATKQAVVALNVAELDATAATDGLLAVMAQFGLSTSDLSSIVDEMSKASDNYLVTTDKILKALQRTGSAAANANLSLEETIGIVTALSKATNRSGENLGTAINSLIQYSSKESALNVFAGLSEQSKEVVEEYKRGAATILDVWRQVSVEIKNLKSDQADMLDAYFSTEDGESLKDALDGELQDVYTEMGGVYDTANTFRKNYFIALLNNMDTVDEAIGKISDSEGYTQEKNAMYMDTYTAKVNALKAQWQEIANDEQGLLGIKKDLVGIASETLKLIKSVGGLKTAILGLGTAIALITGHPVIAAIGAVSTAIASVIGKSQQAKKAAEEAARAETEANRKIVSDWTAIAQNSANFQELYNKYTKQIEKGEEYFETEQKVVGLLGEKASLLKQLAQGTDEYTEAVKNLSAAELEEYLRKAKQAQVAAENNLKNNSFGSFVVDRRTFEDAGIALDGKEVWEEGNWFADGGVLPFRGYVTKYNISGLTGGSDPQSRLNDYKILVESANKLWESYEKERENGETREAEHIYYLWKDINSVIEEYKPFIEDYENATRKIEAYQEKSVEYTEKIVNNLSQISDKQKSIADAVKKYRDEQQKAEQLSEKQLAIEEAKKKVLEEQQNLASAYNERNTRVYNAATGEFELQASGKSVQSAEKNLQTAQENLTKAIESLDEYVKDQAWDEVVDELQAQTATNDSILAIIAKWAAYTTDESFGNEIKSVLGGQVGKLFGKKYDSGGVLTGLGGIKATSRPETVNDPDLTAKILSPQSNERFSQYVRDMNLLFGASESYARNPVISNFNGGNTTNNNGNTYVINGMSISREQADRYSISEIFSNFQIA